MVEQAGVSRPAFCDYFAEEAEGLLAAVADVQQTLAGEVHVAMCV